jgi:hypothetical protein
MYNPSKLAEVRAWTRYFNVARLASFVGILCVPFSLWALFWTSPRDYPFLSSMLFVPLLTYGCVIMFSRFWRRDPFLKLLFGAGIALRLAAAAAYVWTGFVIYLQSVDAFHYWDVGLRRAQEFSSVGWSAFTPPYWSTNLIFNICGIITLLTGNALPTLFVLFALAALWGGYFFYRAFCIAFPLGNRGLYGLLVVLLPSILYWSSAIGKDALAQLTIGLSAYGYARMTRKLDARAILICVIGVAGVAAARAHIAAMLAIAMLLSFSLGKTAGGWMTMAAKILLIPILAAGTVYMIGQAESFVGMAGSDFQSGMNIISKQTKGTEIGGSAFGGRQSLPMRLVEGPFLVFRPFAWEAHNFMSALAALEGLGLFLLAWRRRRAFWAVVRHWRDPYVGFALAFAVQFCVIFAVATSNFGILVRMRIMVLPVLLMLFCAKLPTVGVAESPFERQASWFRSRVPTHQLDQSTR